MSIQTGGVSAESWMGSVRANAIPKDGGNTFKGTFFGAWTNHSLQSANLTPELEARGLHNTDSAKEIWDIAPAFGGPLVKDKLWFFGAWRTWATDFTIAGIYSNKSPVPYVYTPDLTRPSDELDVDMNSSLRLTWQATPRNKFVVHPQYNTGDRDHTYSNKTGPDRFTDPEATIHYYVRPSGFAETTWTAPVTSRLLIEAGSAFAAKDFQNRPQPDIGLQPYSYKELSTNLVWGNLNVASGNNHGYNWIQKLAVSYVTGSHAAKVGMDLQHSKSWSTLDATGPNEMTLQLLNGVPRQVTVFATPYALTEFTKYNLGLYGQDQWTIKHLTLNLGLRYDHLNSYVPAQHAGPAYWTPTRNVDFPEVDNVPNWQDWSPRLGATYDLFGNGKTALKATFGKYLSAPNQGTYTRLANPLNAIASSATRTWNDISPCAGGIVGDFLPQPCELGPVSNAAFGTSVITTSYAPDVNTSRGHDLESSVSVQHE